MGKTKREKMVLELNDENFDQTLKDTEYVFVDFYADWCGPCKGMAPAYKELSELVEKLDNRIKVVKINADKNHNTKNKQEIKYYPTLRLYNNKNDKYVAYAGPRTAQAMLNFIKKLTFFPSNSVDQNQLNELENTIKNEDAHVLYYYKNNDNNVANKFGFDKNNALVVLRKFDGGNVFLQNDENMSVEEMREFLNLNREPIVEKIDTAGVHYFNKRLPGVILVSDHDNNDELFKE